MTTYVNLMLGTLDGRYPPGSINRLVADLNKGVPLRAEILFPDGRTVCELVGRGFIIHLVVQEGDVEPWASHALTGHIERVDPELDTLALAGKLYEALVEAGRYRALIEHRDTVLRSTHFPTGP
ncbi:hypothetical protein GCM10022251_32100 [Phytohabitans flavus]|uniref:Uncharacterized protein n=1 Tax=Phytohabitans flavus TaxID=1076124 RepID=A0A6F8XWG3_9ACTN|nr:hypothetical protein [Phytohabitans flavus]BCB78184.1 hypothetical protein Pflav_045940 [Phytohabitans flavus]